jgi:uncharacterized protein
MDTTGSFPLVAADAPRRLSLDRRTWSALIALLLIVPAPSISALVGLLMGKGPVGVALWVAAKIWMIAVPIIWLKWVDREPLAVSRPGPGLGLAAGLGLAIAALIGVVFMFLGPLWIDPTGMRAVLEPVGLTSKAVYLGAAVFWIFGNSLLEEYVYRWFVFSRAKRLTGTGWAVLISASAFVVHHALSMAAYFDWRVTTLACLGVFVGGVIWSWLYARYENIWAPWLCHAIVDVAVFAVGWVLLFG